MLMPYSAPKWTPAINSASKLIMYMYACYCIHYMYHAIISMHGNSHKQHVKKSIPCTDLPHVCLIHLLYIDDLVNSHAGGL